jgi:hypothetical protein
MGVVVGLLRHRCLVAVPVAQEARGYGLEMRCRLLETRAGGLLARLPLAAPPGLGMGAGASGGKLMPPPPHGTQIDRYIPIYIQLGR